MNEKKIILRSSHQVVAIFPIGLGLDYIYAHTPRNEDEDLLMVKAGGKTYYCDEVDFV